MSTTLTSATMVTQLQQRVPIGLAQSYCTDRLNEAFRYIEAKGSFTWMVKRGVVTVGGGATSGTLPSDCDYGRPMAVQQLTAISIIPTTLPWLPPDKFFEAEAFIDAIPGQWAAWTNVLNTAYFAPASAVSGGATTPVLTYHRYTPVVAYGANYYPSPDWCDDLILISAEAEVRRRYNLATLDQTLMLLKAQLESLLEQYRSTEETLVGLGEETRKAQEIQTERSVL